MNECTNFGIISCHLIDEHKLGPFQMPSTLRTIENADDISISATVDKRIFLK